MRRLSKCATIGIAQPMQGVNNDNFGPLIAYLVPGLVVLLGFSLFSPMLQSWLAAAPDTQPTIGGFLFLTVSSIAVGMTVSAVRWAVVDTLHAKTGLALPAFNFSRLGENVDAYQLLIEIHYRHYQYYANMFVATAIAYACYRINLASWRLGGVDIAFIAVEAVFLLTSRDTLGKYYRRTAQLLAGAGISALPDESINGESESPSPADPQTPPGSDQASHRGSAAG